MASLRRAIHTTALSRGIKEQQLALEQQLRDLEANGRAPDMNWSRRTGGKRVVHFGK